TPTSQWRTRVSRRSASPANGASRPPACASSSTTTPRGGTWGSSARRPSTCSSSTSPSTSSRRDRAGMTSRVLVGDDEPQILRTVGLDLRAHDYVVDLAETGEAALDLAARNHPDVVVVDLGLPGIGGLDVIERLRRSTRIPIVVLSVRDTEADKVA